MTRFTQSTIGVCLLTVGVPGSAGAQARPAADPVPAIGAILDAFEAHDIVTVNNSHGEVEVEAFVLSLIRDPRFPALVDDVVDENGNGLYQAVMDRYVRGEDVPYAELRHVWENTTQAQAVSPRDGSIPALYRAVREINARSPANEQVRVLLGDPPIDWERVATPDDYRRWFNLRDSYPAAAIQVEVLAKGRRALVVYGQGHAQRRQIASNYDMSTWQAQTLVSILEDTTPARLFTVWWEDDPEVMPANVADWPVPSLARVRDTRLGQRDFADFFEEISEESGRPGSRVSVGPDGRFTPVPGEEWLVVPLEDQFDAVLWLGPASAMTMREGRTPALCADPDYLAMRLARMALAGLPPPVADDLRDYCARQ